MKGLLSDDVCILRKYKFVVCVCVCGWGPLRMGLGLAEKDSKSCGEAHYDTRVISLPQIAEGEATMLCCPHVPGKNPIIEDGNSHFRFVFAPSCPYILFGFCPIGSQVTV